MHLCRVVNEKDGNGNNNDSSSKPHKETALQAAVPLLRANAYGPNAVLDYFADTNSAAPVELEE